MRPSENPQLVSFSSSLGLGTESNALRKSMKIAHDITRYFIGTRLLLSWFAWFLAFSMNLHKSLRLFKVDYPFMNPR